MVVEKDRRVADVETRYDPTRGIFNRLFATASPLFVEVASNGGLPPLRNPARGRFVVENFFADLKRHDLGPRFHELNFDGSVQKEFMTEPLWGVGSTSPYGHDGRSINLNEVILRHGGEAEDARRRYASAGSTGQHALLAFLESLVLFPPDDTASNLNPGDPHGCGLPAAGSWQHPLAGAVPGPDGPRVARAGGRARCAARRRPARVCASGGSAPRSSAASAPVGRSRASPPRARGSGCCASASGKSSRRSPCERPAAARRPARDRPRPARVSSSEPSRRRSRQRRPREGGSG